MSLLLLWIMVIVLTVACLFLIFVVLIQSGKGGGLGGAFGGGGAMADSLGASGAEKTLGRWTVYAAIAFGVLSLSITFMASRQTQSSLFDTLDEQQPAAATAPVTPGEAAPADGAAVPMDNAIEVTEDGPGEVAAEEVVDTTEAAAPEAPAIEAPVEGTELGVPEEPVEAPATPETE
jgi:preprotein translocase subunit SecG